MSQPSPILDQCPFCTYDMSKHWTASGVAVPCPECGLESTRLSARNRHEARYGRYKGWLTAGIALPLPTSIFFYPIGPFIGLGLLGTSIVMMGRYSWRSKRGEAIVRSALLVVGLNTALALALMLAIWLLWVL